MGAGWFSNYLGLLKRSLSIIPLKGRVQGMEPTHSHGPLANATAPSAGGSPVPDGEDSRRGAEAQRGIGRWYAATSELLSATALAC